MKLDKKTKELLEECRSMIRDSIIKGWREDELCCSGTKMVSKLTGVLGDDYDIDYGGLKSEMSPADLEKYSGDA